VDQKWTYFVQSVDGGPIKIGITRTSPEARLSGLQTGSPLQLRIVGLIAGDQEKMLHERFAKIRLHGEWFTPTDELIDFIKQTAIAGLLKHNVQKKQIEIQQQGLTVPAVTVQDAGCGFFDRIHKNDNELFENLLRHHNWKDTSDEFPDCDLSEEEMEEQDEQIRSEWDAIEHFVFTIDGERFVDAVGINYEAGLIGFICGPCNSERRFLILKELACIAWDLDYIAPEWFCFAMFYDGPKHIGIHLTLLAYDTDKSGRYVFDPAILGKKPEEASSQ